MFINESELIKILAEYKISANAILFCHLLYKNDLASIYRYENEVEYLDNDLNLHRGWSRGDLQKAVESGFLINMNKIGENYPDHYTTTTKFDKIMKIELGEIFEEILEIYPNFINIKGKLCPTKSCDVDVLKNIYVKNIGQSLTKHEEVKELLKWAIDTKAISMGVEKFVKSSFWKSLQEIKETNNFGDLGIDV